MRVFISAFFTETNTFSPIPTGLDDFDVTRREDLLIDQEELEEDIVLGRWSQEISAIGGECIFGLSAYAQPAGIVVQPAYEKLSGEIVEEIRSQNSIDIVLLYLHGAMVSQQCEDCEGDLLSRIRGVVGPNVVIAVALDLHCHLSDSMLESADVLVTFREYPHSDIGDTASRALDLAVQVYKGHCRPEKMVFDCKMVGLYPTSTYPMCRIVQSMIEAEQKENILSVSFIHGFPFGDVSDGGSKVLVITNNERDTASQVAHDFGMEIYNSRTGIGFPFKNMKDAFFEALSLIRKEAGRNKKPVVIADQSDNAGGGAPGDATFALKWILDNQIVGAAVAIFYDPEVVRLAIAAGIGNYIKVRLGGKMGLASGAPLDIYVKVKAIQHGYFHLFPQDDSKPIYLPLGDTVAISCGGVDIVVSSKRCQCYHPSIFDDLNVCIDEKSLLVVKSMQHFYAGFSPIARKIIYMAAPGAVSPCVDQIHYEKMSTVDRYPWNDDPLNAIGTPADGRANYSAR